MSLEHGAPFWRVPQQDVVALFAAAAKAAPQRTYIKTQNLSLSYAGAQAKIADLAESLGPEVRGRTVALVLPNSAAFLVAYFAVLAAGASPALVNYGHPDATVVKLLEGLDVAAVLSDRQIDGLEITEFNDAAVAALQGESGNLSAPNTQSAGAIMFSGGTTGLPKQVPHSHGALLAKVERMEWGWPTGDGETWLPVAPFTHIYGFLMGVLNPIMRGGTIVIPPRFHPDLVVDLLQDQGVTIFGGGPPAIYQAIMASEKFASAQFPALRVCPGGGAPFPLDVHQRWHAATGLPITEGYGMTEIAPICVNTESDGMKPGSAGKAVPDTVIEIVDAATGTDVLPAGETGEIRVKGPHMMVGYTGNAEETAKAMRDGFVYTGDIGSLDAEGFLTISDRKKDVIFVKGFNVFPREVEETLMSHPSITGACVVGRADERAGEVPVAFVTLQETVDVADLFAFCGETLADYKMPQDIMVLDALPMTPAAKVDRTELRRRAKEKV